MPEPVDETEDVAVAPKGGALANLSSRKLTMAGTAIGALTFIAEKLASGSLDIPTGLQMSKFITIVACALIAVQGGIDAIKAWKGRV